MKNVLLCLLVCALFPLTAQITLDSNDFPKAGDNPTFSLGDTLLNIDLSQTGPNYNWDFSNLSPINQTTDSFISKNDLPFTLQFSLPRRVNVAGFINTPDSLPGAGISLSGGYDLYAVTGGAYESIGQATVLGGLLPVVLEKEPSDTIFSLPLNYMDSGNGSSFADIALPIPTFGDVYYEQGRTREYTADGWGQLTTPYGQFQVLRTRSEVQGSDSTRIVLTATGDTNAFRVPIPVQVSYQWWAKGERAPILQINAAVIAGNEIVTQVRYRDSVRNLRPNSIDRQFEQHSLSISPNPASDIATISWDMQGKPGYLEVFDMNGKQIITQQLRSNEAPVSVSGIPAGSYLLRIVELGGSRVFLGRLLVE